MLILSLLTPFSALRNSLEGSLSGDDFSPPRFDVLPGSLSHVLIRFAEQEGVVLVLDKGYWSARFFLNSKMSIRFEMILKAFEIER